MRTDHENTGQQNLPYLPRFFAVVGDDSDLSAMFGFIVARSVGGDINIMCRAARRIQSQGYAGALYRAWRHVVSELDALRQYNIWYVISPRSRFVSYALPEHWTTARGVRVGIGDWVTYGDWVGQIVRARRGDNRITIDLQDGTRECDVNASLFNLVATSTAAQESARRIGTLVAAHNPHHSLAVFGTVKAAYRGMVLIEPTPDFAMYASKWLRSPVVSQWYYAANALPMLRVPNFSTGMRLHDVRDKSQQYEVVDVRTYGAWSAPTVLRQHGQWKPVTHELLIYLEESHE